MPHAPSSPGRGRGAIGHVIARHTGSVVLAGAVIAGLLVSNPAAAVQPIEDAAVEVTLTTVEPGIPQPGDEFRLAGTVTNTSDIPLNEVNALIRYNGSPLQTREELSLLDSEPRVLWGFRPGTPFFDELTPILAPGESIDFELETVLDLSCPPREPEGEPCIGLQFPGVYVIGVDIMATSPDEARTQAGTVLTVLPWLIDGADSDLPVAMLWPVAAQPSLRPGGTAADGTAAAQFGPTGQLHALVDAPGDAPVTWAVDPDVINTATSVVASDTTQATGASSWLDALADSTAGQETWLLPYALPDLEAFDETLASDLATQASQLTHMSRDELPEASTEVAWPLGGYASESVVQALARTGVTRIVLSEDAVTPHDAGPWVQIEHAGDEVSGLLTDGVLDTIIRDTTSPGGRHARLALRQRWLAETALAALEPTTQDRPLVTGPPPGWQTDAELADHLIDMWTTTPWIEPVALDALVGSDPPTVQTNDEAVQAVLPEQNASAAAELQASMSQYEALLAEPTDSDDSSVATLRAASATWRDDPAAGQSYIAEISEDVRSRLQQVSLTVAPTVTLSSNTGVFPVNVINGLDEPVDVRLDVQSANPDRMSLEPVTVQRIEAGETETIGVTAEAVANGRVRVDMQLATVDGDALGAGTHTVVNATDYGILGWLLIAGAALLFVAGLALRTIRGRRRNGMNGATGELSVSLDEVKR